MTKHSRPNFWSHGNRTGTGHKAWWGHRQIQTQVCGLRHCRDQIPRPEGQGLNFTYKRTQLRSHLIKISATKASKCCLKTFHKPSKLLVCWGRKKCLSSRGMQIYSCNTGIFNRKSKKFTRNHVATLNLKRKTSMFQLKAKGMNKRYNAFG